MSTVDARVRHALDEALEAGKLAVMASVRQLPKTGDYEGVAACVDAVASCVQALADWERLPRQHAVQAAPLAGPPEPPAELTGSHRSIAPRSAGSDPGAPPELLPAEPTSSYRRPETNEEIERRSVWTAEEMRQWQQERREAHGGDGPDEHTFSWSHDGGLVEQRPLRVDPTTQIPEDQVPAIDGKRPKGVL